MECSCRLCPTPGMYAVISIPEVSRTRATLRRARVRLLRCRRVDARAHAATLRAALQGRCLGLGDLVLPALADQLLDGGHLAPLLALRSLFCLLRVRPTRSGVSRLVNAGQNRLIVVGSRLPSYRPGSPRTSSRGSSTQQDVPGAGHGEKQYPGVDFPSKPGSPTPSFHVARRPRSGGVRSEAWVSFPGPGVRQDVLKAPVIRAMTRMKIQMIVTAAQNPILIQATIFAEVTRPVPVTQPLLARISRRALLAKTRAMIAGMIGQNTHDTIDRTSPATALFEVFGAGPYAGGGG